MAPEFIEGLRRLKTGMEKLGGSRLQSMAHDRWSDVATEFRALRSLDNFWLRRRKPGGSRLGWRDGVPRLQARMEVALVQPEMEEAQWR